MNRSKKIIVNYGPSITVDPDAYVWLRTMTWYQTVDGARTRLEDGSYRLLHRMVVGNPAKMCVGFRDGDETNCRRENLFVFPHGAGKRMKRQLRSEDERQQRVAAPGEPVALPISDGTTVLIDADQYERFAGRDWHRQWGRAACFIPGGWTSFLHREIMGSPRGLCVGFLDGDMSNCQRANLFLHVKGEMKATRKIILEGKLGLPAMMTEVDAEPTDR